MGAFDRMSRREKTMVLGLLGFLVLVVFSGAYFWLSTSISSLEVQVSEELADLGDIYRLAETFAEKKAVADRQKNMAAKNRDTNIKLAINEIAKSVMFEDQRPKRDDDSPAKKKLADVIQYEQTQETFLSKRKRRRRKGKDPELGYFRRDQKVKLSEVVPFRAVYDFLDRVERSDKMLFVSELDLRRQYNNGLLARKNAAVTIATFFYKAEEEE